MSKVIHVRLSDDCIYIAMEVLKSSGIDVTNLPMATIVRKYMEGSTENYKAQKSLSIPDDVAGIIALLSEDTIAPLIMSDIKFVPPVLSGVDQDRLADIQRAMTNVANADTIPEVSITAVEDVVEAEEVLPPPPWEALHIMAWATILDKAPRDILIEQVVEAKSIPYQRAVQVVYSDIPFEDWGSKSVINLVKKIQPTINKYFKEEN